MKKIKGFTFVELIVVMAVISIISILGYARFANVSVFREMNGVESVTSALKIAQKTAISQRRDIYMIYSSNNLNLCYTNSNPCPLNQKLFINSVEFVINLQNITVSIPANLKFNMAGIASSNNIIIPIGSKNITIYGETGYIKHD